MTSEDRESSSSERELDTTDLANGLLREKCTPNSALDILKTEKPQETDVENEYDYVLRDNLDSVVARRLAQGRNISSGTEPLPKIPKSEISLNAQSLPFHELSVSPNATDNEIIENVSEMFVESTSSLPPALPSVEDGLSSGNVSDNEEPLNSITIDQVLDRSSVRESVDMQVREFFNQTEVSTIESEDDKTKIDDRKKALDDAIKEIQDVLQQSNSLLQSPASNAAAAASLNKPADDQDVWVKRNNIVNRAGSAQRVFPSGPSTSASLQTSSLNLRDFRSTSPQQPLLQLQQHQPQQQPLQQQTHFLDAHLQPQQPPLFKPVFHPHHSNFTDSLEVSRYRDVSALPPSNTSPVALVTSDSNSSSVHVPDCPYHPDNMTGAEQVGGACAERDSSVDTESEVDKYVAEYLQTQREEDGYDEGAPSVYIKQPDPDEDTDAEAEELLTGNKHRKPDARQNFRPPPPPTPDLSQDSASATAHVREVALQHPDDDTVLIEGVLFRARYLGSTTLLSDTLPSKKTRMLQAQEAIGNVKAPEGENQPGGDVDLFVSEEKVMVLSTSLKEILMDHLLRSISYIADIGDIVVIMARRGPAEHLPPESSSQPPRIKTKTCCHVFESEEAQLIAQSIGQAFQMAYMRFLKENGIEDSSFVREMDYQEVLNQQEIYGEELHLFASKEKQKEVVVAKSKGEPLNIVVVESGWGSMVPTVVLANMGPSGAAARCGKLNIGDQIMSINGVSLVGLPLLSCQNYIKAVRTQSAVKLNVVSCTPVVEVCIKRPDSKYQLGFSVQNGVICSLLRGGIAERGGVRVGHRIIEINSQSVVAVAHERIVSMLATAVGEIHMKTMPTSIFRLLTGQETPHFI